MKLTMDFLFVTSTGSGLQGLVSTIQKMSTASDHMQEMMAVLGGRGKGSWRLLKKLIGGGKWVEWGSGGGGQLPRRHRRRINQVLKGRSQGLRRILISHYLH